MSTSFSGIVECSTLVLLSKNFSSNIERERKRDKEINRDREMWGEEGRSSSATIIMELVSFCFQNTE